MALIARAVNPRKPYEPLLNPCLSFEHPSRPAIDGHQVRFDEDRPEGVSKDLEEHEQGLLLQGLRG